MEQPDLKNLRPYGRMAEKHWKEHRPKMYRELQKKGKLNQALKLANDQTSDQMCNLIQKGLQEHEAWEIVGPQYILLPSEDDMPDLGENPE